MAKTYEDLAVWITIDRVQELAEQEVGRKLDEDELERVCNRLESATYFDLVDLMKNIFDCEIEGYSYP